MAESIILIELYRAQHGTVPENLDDLTPYSTDNFIDPYGGTPIHYQHLDSGYRLYCLGMDREDDGGAMRDDGNQMEEGDWPLTRIHLMTAEILIILAKEPIFYLLGAILTSFTAVAIRKERRHYDEWGHLDIED